MEMWELARTSETVSSTQRSAGAAGGRVGGGGGGGGDVALSSVAAAAVAVDPCPGGEIEDDAGVHRTNKLWRATESSPRTACRGSVPELATGLACPLPLLEISEALFKFASLHPPGAEPVDDHSARRLIERWNLKETVVGGPLLTTISSVHSLRSLPQPSPLSARQLRTQGDHPMYTSKTVHTYIPCSRCGVPPRKYLTQVACFLGSLWRRTAHT